MTRSTLFARARVLFHVYKTDNSLKLFKLRQISVFHTSNSVTMKQPFRIPNKWHFKQQAICYVIVHPCHNFKAGITKPLLQLCTMGSYNQQNSADVITRQLAPFTNMV